LSEIKARCAALTVNLPMMSGDSIMIGRRALIFLTGAMVSTVALYGSGFSQGRTNNSLTPNGYQPHLGDLMTTMQIRHDKLWLAGKFRNWPLAAYEIDLMLENFQDIALLYPGVPVADMATLSKPTKVIGDAIAEKSAAKFTQAFAMLTSACNSCHQSIGRGYIVIQTPAASKFGNQVFPPK